MYGVMRSVGPTSRGRLKNHQAAAGVRREPGPVSGGKNEEAGSENVVKRPTVGGRKTRGNVTFDTIAPSLEGVTDMLERRQTNN